MISQQTGWVKLHRNLIDWDYYDNKNCLVVLIHLLLTVNYKDKDFKGIPIKAGSRVISLAKFSEEVRLTERQTRTVLKCLINDKQIVMKTTNKFSIVSLVKWDELQNENFEDVIQTTIKKSEVSHSNDKQKVTQTTTSKELKEIKKFKKEEFINNLNLNASLKEILELDFSFSELFINYWTGIDEPTGKMKFQLLPFFDFERQIELFWANRQKILNQKPNNHGNKSKQSKFAQQDARKREILDALDQDGRN